MTFENYSYNIYLITINLKRVIASYAVCTILHTSKFERKEKILLHDDEVT
jgi:hypothetical protein